MKEPTKQADDRVKRLDALLAQRTELDRTISELLAEVAADLRERIKTYGLTHDDLFGRTPTPRRKRGNK